MPQSDNKEDNKLIALKEKIYQINEKTAFFYHENLYNKESTTAQEYVKKRKLDNKTLKAFVIGYSNPSNKLYKYLIEEGFSEEEILASNLVVKTTNGAYIDRFRGRLIFPIQDIRNRVIAFGGRVLDDSKPKYVNSPESLVYSKGRHLYGLNIAKKEQIKDIIIVEGYMDCVSLHQRGINNAVASLGTALTEAQGRLLRKYGQKVIIGYDEDGAGQNATMRGLDILNNLGCDLRILQWEGAKDPDEYIIKYGSGRFKMLVDNAISLVEFKVKTLKQNMSLDSTNDKIKFLKEIAKILTNVNNQMEQEIYIDKISQDYKISKEALYAEINKMQYANNSGKGILERNVAYQSKPKSKNRNESSEAIEKREKIVIWLLINNPQTTYINFKDRIKPEDMQIERNKNILKILYDAYENGNSNINLILNSFEEEDVNYITEIMAENFEISDVTKGIKDILIIYSKEKLIKERNKVIEELNKSNNENKEELEQKLNQIIIQLSKLK